MTATAVQFRQQIDPDGTVERLLESAATLSYDPDQEIDWDAPLDPTKYGLNPQWSTLYGTRLWDEMSQEQRIALTRHEVGSIMSTGIWFEMILQQMVLRDQYSGAYAGAQFQFALTEIADECRHSLMFAKTCAKLGVPQYRPKLHVRELARGLKSVAGGEIAYGGILVAEEILDVMQRDWMRGENVLDEIRTTSKIHVVEEARHMKFARHEIREHLKGASELRRKASATFIAGAAKFVVESLVADEVYANVGLDRDRAVAEAKANTHHQNLMRMSCVHLMDFLSDAGLLTPYAMRLYRSVHML